MLYKEQSENIRLYIPAAPLASKGFVIKVKLKDRKIAKNNRDTLIQNLKTLSIPKMENSIGSLVLKF